MNGLRKVIACLVSTLLAAAIPAVAQAGDTPHIVEKQGRHALIVDGAPFLMLGAQANNSSAWPSALPRVWPAMEALNVNTVEMPVAWEQIEPQEGHFDFTVVDTLLEQARARNLRLVLLWFATWKNTNPQYAPRWVKLDNRRFPRMVREDGTFHYALSPFGGETLKADSKAFAALMHHLREVDPQNTVIMMQVENEAGSYGLARDHAPVAEAAFKAPVPAALRARLHKPAGSWAELFGRDADLYFHAWQVARYIDAVAAAGKAEKPLPMYVNAALPGDPFTWQDAKTYASGGPANTVIDVYKAAAPISIWWRPISTIRRIGLMSVFSAPMTVRTMPCSCRRPDMGSTMRASFSRRWGAARLAGRLLAWITPVMHLFSPRHPVWRASRWFPSRPIMRSSVPSPASGPDWRSRARPGELPSRKIRSMDIARS
jgi:hypothetical protein